MRERLIVRGRVACAAAELGLTGGVGTPRKVPSDPGPGIRLLIQLCRVPAGATVDAHLHQLHRTVARPSPAVDDTRLAMADEPAAGGEVGDARRSHQGARQHSRDRLALVFRLLTESVAARLLVATEGLTEHRDASEPLDVGHAVPPGHDQP